MARRRSVRSGFEQRFLAALRAAGVEKRDLLTVGFSGGADSLAMACALSRVQGLLDVETLLVHVDHQVRPGSERDRAICQTIADKLGLGFHWVQLEAGLRDRAGGVGIEEAARRERYLALASAAIDWGSNTILLGHQANDQAETVLLHLFRGAGSKGLAGMSPREERSIPWWPASDGLVGRFAIIRPLLAEPRSAIDAYVSEIGISPIQDESNEATDFDRNWIRHNVLPAILQRWPAAIASIDRMAAIVRTEFELLDIATEEFVTEEIDRDRTLCRDELLRLPFPLAQRVIRHWLSELGVSDVNHDVVARCYELARSGRESREIEAGNGVSIVVAGGCLTSLDELIESTARRRPMLGASGRTLWEISTDTGDGEPDGVVWAPVDRSVELRTLRRGDRWLGTERSVFEDLRSAGIHPLLRTQVLALVADGGVLLIPAIYPTIRARTADGPVKKVEVRWRRLEGRGQRSARIRGSSAF